MNSFDLQISFQIWDPILYWFINLSLVEEYQKKIL